MKIGKSCEPSSLELHNSKMAHGGPPMWTIPGTVKPRQVHADALHFMHFQSSPHHDRGTAGTHGQHSTDSARMYKLQDQYIAEINDTSGRSQDNANCWLFCGMDGP